MERMARDHYTWSPSETLGDCGRGRPLSACLTRLGLHPREVAVQPPARIDVILGRGELLRRRGSEARLALEKLLHRNLDAARVELHRRLTAWIVAIEKPLAGIDHGLLVLHRRRHLETMGDAVAVGDDQRGPFVGLRLDECLEGVLVFRTEGHAGDVDVLVGHGDEAEVFFGRRFSAGGEFRYGRAWRGL